MTQAVCQRSNLEVAFNAGMQAFAVPPPQTLDEWASEHFYLSAESSYVEQEWRPWPYQRAIMSCISNDDIREVDWIKAARTGNTKIMLAAIGYFAEHKRRNQCMWRPTDADSVDFVKSSLDPMLRDVSAMKHVFPQYLARHRNNTLDQKTFLGSVLRLRGGKAAKNYRDFSIDVGYIDEADAFDLDVEKEGDPFTLAAKRVEGATFPKMVVGSTPKLKGFSLIDARATQADMRVTFVVPCYHCGSMHPITWGGKDEVHGFKWTDKDPETVRHLCRSCGSLMSQGEFLEVWERGYYRSADGLVRLDADGSFSSLDDGTPLEPPAHIAFVDVWTAYSPRASWVNIVKDFLAAHEVTAQGDQSKLKAFWNTTLGRVWELEVEKTDADELQARAEPYRLGEPPMGCLFLLCGVDTQDNRLEAVVWGYGRNGEMWCIDHQVFWGNPGKDDVWLELAEFREKEYRHTSGQVVRISGMAVDTGGHFTHAVYDFCAHHARRKVFAVAGRSGREKAIKDGSNKVDIDWRGRLRKFGVILWQVGTNHAKDLIYSRLQTTQPGPGYVHFSNELSDEFFRQMAGEVRGERVTARGRESRWQPIRKRVEAWDCTVYATWLEAHFELSRKPAKWWDELEELVQPAVADMFADSSGANAPDSERLSESERHDVAPRETPVIKRRAPRQRDWRR
jgi:phage terminase large subunit GpA-like protein